MHVVSYVLFYPGAWADQKAAWVYMVVNPSVLGFNYHIHLSSMVMQCKVKYTDFQLVNSNSITSGISYNQFLIDRDSCSDIVGYFYDVAPG